MVFEYGMGELAQSRTVRADNYALSEETKRMRDSEQARLTDGAYEEALRLMQKHRVALDRVALDRVAVALLDKETLDRDELLEVFSDVVVAPSSSDAVGVIRALGADTTV